MTDPLVTPVVVVCAPALKLAKTPVRIVKTRKRDLFRVSIGFPPNYELTLSLRVKKLFA